MKKQDFNFELPEALIARYPAPERTGSRLLCVDKNAATLTHKIFRDLPALIQQNDLLIFNDTRVLRARLRAEKKTGGKVEIFLDRFIGTHEASVLIKSSKANPPGTKFYVNQLIEFEVIAIIEDKYYLRLNDIQSFDEVLQKYGEMPIPPYFERAAEAIDDERYQTIFAVNQGAVAAPTAGLHFDASLMEKLQEKGVHFGFVTLHVGLGTFQPIRVEDLTQHKMHSEIMEVTDSLCQLIEETKARQGRIIAVGTTTLRALESAAKGGDLKPFSGETDIFIYPGYHFNVVDALITNFHLPESTLMMLICAFAGHENVMNAYCTAVKEAYRFYSYGDAMWLERA